MPWTAARSPSDLVQGTYAQKLDRDCGDPHTPLRRRVPYQLAVVVDDAAQGVNSVVRGVDLLCSTPQQRYSGSSRAAAPPMRTFRCS
ncbi:MAG: hypothetical protein ACLUW6_09265 [Coriobacteriaceae bacterium]